MPIKDNLQYLSAHGLGQLNLRKIVLDGNDTAASREGPNIDHEHLTLGEFCDLAMPRYYGWAVQCLVLHAYLILGTQAA